ncbi:DAHL domain-containing protein [Aestuariirhabdus sp. LZHN29]|uniref:DAHL domain-containing protein n=1 Tax=Aestuariirhabdus sp. LZHN29 TaxID=3417462 RepID=UPI003CFA96A3
MKPSTLLIVFFLLALGGGSALFYYETQLPDIDSIGSDVNERLLQIDGLDSSVSELALRSRIRLDTNYDALVSSTTQLDSAIEKLESDYFGDDSMEGSLVQQRFVAFRSELENKKDLIENFKSHNSVLRNSERYAPLVGRELMAVAEEQGLAEVARFYSNVVFSVMDYATQGQLTSADDLRAQIGQIPETEALLPAESLSRIIEFTNHVATVVEEKRQTDRYLASALGSTSDARMGELVEAFGAWQVSKGEAQQQFMFALTAYIALLLLFSGLIAFKLRSLYVSLDAQVAERTAQVEEVFEDLQNSEKQLMQTEKMASLGQLVAGVAHQINTPLGYISSNIDTVKANLSEVTSLYQIAGLMEREATRKPADRAKLSELMKRNILLYRKIKQSESMQDVNELLDDSGHGLKEIAQLVDSLREFSRAESGDAQPADIHQGLEATLKICGHVIGERKVVTRYDEALPLVTCMPAQLNQVFMNVLTNAAQATQTDSGEIVIETRATDDGVEILFRDNGMGMDPVTQSRMFDPFFTTKGVNEGTGLGMSICYKIMQSHGGEIVVRSEPGQGTEICLQLPRVA